MRTRIAVLAMIAGMLWLPKTGMADSISDPREGTMIADFAEVSADIVGDNLHVSAVFYEDQNWDDVNWFFNFDLDQNESTGVPDAGYGFGLRDDRKIGSELDLYRVGFDPAVATLRDLSTNAKNLLPVTFIGSTEIHVDVPIVLLTPYKFDPDQGAYIKYISGSMVDQILDGSVILTLRPRVVPAPPALALTGIGLLMLACRARKR